MVPALATLLNDIQGKVKQTQRRQGLQLFFRALPLCLSISLLLGIVAALVIPGLGYTWLGWEAVVTISAFVLGIGSALVWAYVKRPEANASALALDQAFGLEERVLTLTTLKTEQQSTEAAQLLAQQMQQRVKDVHVAERFPLQLNRRPWYAPLGAVLTLIIALVFPSTGLFSGSTIAEMNKEKETKAAEQKPVDISEFKQANEERKKRLKEIGSVDLNEMQKEIDQLLQKLEKTPEGSAEAKMAIEDVTKLTERVQKQEQLKEQIEEVKKQLKLEMGEKFKGDKGPAEEFTKALSKADFEKARKEMAKLAEKMQKGEMSKEEMKELGKQMQNLKEKLDEIAQQKEKLDALEKSNLDPETKAKEKEKIEKEMSKMKDLADLAKQMQEAAEQMEKGDKEAAREALENMAEELGKMEMTEQEMQELQITEGDLQDLKKCLGGMKGKGGKKGKKDSWDQDGEKGDGEQGGQPSRQGPPGQGAKVDDESEGGLRNETINDTNSEDTTSKGKSTNNGKLIVVGEGPKQGKPGKDNVKERITLSPAELDQAKQQASEALKQQRISQTQKNVVTDFYKNLAPGK
jgi:hypothetical protein